MQHSNMSAESLPQIESNVVSIGVSEEGRKSQKLKAKLRPGIASGRRVRVKTACTNCKIAKARCDNNRPCIRCAKRGFPHRCVDAIPKRRGRKRSHDQVKPPLQATMMPEGNGMAQVVRACYKTGYTNPVYGLGAAARTTRFTEVQGTQQRRLNVKVENINNYLQVLRQNSALFQQNTQLMKAMEQQSGWVNNPWQQTVANMSQTEQMPHLHLQQAPILNASLQPRHQKPILQQQQQLRKPQQQQQLQQLQQLQLQQRQKVHQALTIKPSKPQLCQAQISPECQLDKSLLVFQVVNTDIPRRLQDVQIKGKKEMLVGSPSHAKIEPTTFTVVNNLLQSKKLGMVLEEPEEQKSEQIMGRFQKVEQGDLGVMVNEQITTHENSMTQERIILDQKQTGLKQCDAKRCDAKRCDAKQCDAKQQPLIAHGVLSESGTQFRGHSIRETGFGEFFTDDGSQYSDSQLTGQNKNGFRERMEKKAHDLNCYLDRIKHQESSPMETASNSPSSKENETKSVLSLKTPKGENLNLFADFLEDLPMGGVFTGANLDQEALISTEESEPSSYFSSDFFVSGI